MNALYIFLSILIPPIVGSMMLYIYKSKCSNVRLCCGLIEVKRDVRGEEKCDINNQNNNLDIINSV
jgi:hypothetical protein